MKPVHLVGRMLDESNKDGASLSKEEIQAVYLNDYTGDLGLRDVSYAGPSKSGHRYVALFYDDHNADGAWMVSDIFISNKAGTLSLDFAGSTDFESHDEKKAREYFAKETHVQGGGSVKPLPKSGPLPYHNKPYSPNLSQRHYRMRSGSGDSPHWDGNRYAL